MKVGTPLGEYPFEFRRLERRGRSVAIVGIVAGLESSVVVGSQDVSALVRKVALPLALLGVIVGYATSRRTR